MTAINFVHNEQLQNLAVYIHWPFCKMKCPYCDFNSHVRENIDYNLWLTSYCQEIKFYAPTLKNKKITSIFFGGGTPSLMPPFIVAAIIDAIGQYGYIDADTEITLEANPTSAEADNFYGYSQAGVNRLSLGIQAFVSKDLQFLGRNHNVDEAKDAIKLAATIFKNYSFDLIYARPGQTVDSWHEELLEALQYTANHISLYQLTIEKGTKFYSMYNKNQFVLPSNDLAGELFDFTNSYLQNEGFRQYEISNYAKSGFESRHNLAYWQYQDYLGIGPGAHSRISYLDKDMWHMQALSLTARPESWLKQVQEFGTGVQNLIKLSREEIKWEILLMGLRLRSGVGKDKFRRYLDSDIVSSLNEASLNNLNQQGLLIFDQNHIKLSEAGLKILNSILLKLL